MDQKILIEKLLRAFTEADKPLKTNEISKAVGIPSSSGDHQLMKNTLRFLENQGIIEKSARRRYMLTDQKAESTFKGRLSIQNDTGFVYTDSKTFPKISVKRRHLHTGLDGDIVMVKLHAFKKLNKPKGEVIQILKRKSSLITGTIDFDGSFYFLIPDEQKYYIDFLVHSSNLNGAKEGDKVSAQFLSWDDPLKSPQAEVIEIIGKAGDSKAEYLTVMKEFSLPESFPKDVEQAAAKIDKRITPAIIKSRLDLRKELIITIDPADAKDFDDGLSLKILDNGNYYLGVHIADVSYYVKQDSAIDKEALRRATSIYLTDQVVPMLPEVLSNDVCSLRPNRNRLAYSIFMEITPKGVVKDYQIAESVIRSKKRFSYEQVQKMIDGSDGPHKDFIMKLHELADLLREKRFEKGGIDFQTYEIKFLLDDKKTPIKALIKRTIPATSLVEECMLIANKTIAENINKLSKKIKYKGVLPFIYRIHDEPALDKIKTVMEFIRMFASAKRIKYGSSKEINQMLSYFEDKPEKPIIHQMLVRAMPKAEYSTENIGHYGLGFEEYTHFTSPIRRYPDLLVHRLTKMYMEKVPSQKALNALVGSLEDKALQSTAMERFSMEAERASSKLTATIFASKHLGKDYDGTISGVMNFGLFVLLDDIYCEGLLHIRDMVDDYYIFDEKNFRLTGKRHKKIFQFGKRLRVRIIKVNVEKRRVDLKLISDKPKGNRPGI
jgi:ribonuclease R